jgi:formylglycine-generating enzyme required for sulfatase activity
VPEEGYTWPKTYLLEGVVSGFLEGSQVQLAVGAWHRIQDPHRSFTIASTVNLAHIVVGCYGNQFPEPTWSPPYGDEKSYDEPHYAPWVDKGDIIIITVPEGHFASGNLQWIVSGWREFWQNIPVEGIGDTFFYTRGGSTENKNPAWTYPDDYIPSQQYADVLVYGYPYPYPCSVYHTTDGLSFGSLCGEIVTARGEIYPLDNGIDESGIGLYGPGFVGRNFKGIAPASGFLRLYINMGTANDTFTISDVNTRVNIIDLDNDSSIGMNDISLLLETWLSSDSNAIYNNTDLDNDGIVNFLIAGQWLEGFELPIAGEVVFVEGGLFPYQHNTTNEQLVDVSSFYINKYEVTNDQYCQFLNETDPCGIHYYYEQVEIIRYGIEGFYSYRVLTGKENHPVRNLNFYDALAYAQWVRDITGQNWRLPTEIEWEKAAAWNPDTQHYYLYGYQQDVISCSWCNILGCVGDETQVGYYDGTEGRNNAVSFYGCYDMTGNLWEFTTKPDTGACVIRGGSWGNNADQAKNNYRWEYTPTNYSWYIGLRLVREANE